MEGEEDEKGAAGGTTTEEGDRGGEERREPAAAARAAADVEGGRRTRRPKKPKTPLKKPSSVAAGRPPVRSRRRRRRIVAAARDAREALCRDLGLGPRVVDRVARSAGFGAKGRRRVAKSGARIARRVREGVQRPRRWTSGGKRLETFSSEEGEGGGDVEQRTEEEGEGVVGERNASSSSENKEASVVVVRDAESGREKKPRRPRVPHGRARALEAGDGSSKTDDSPDGGATGESSSPPALLEESASAPDYVDFSPFPPEPLRGGDGLLSETLRSCPFASGFDDALDAYFAAVESRARYSRARPRVEKRFKTRREGQARPGRRVASLAKEVATAALHAELVERNVDAVDVALNAVNAALAGGRAGATSNGPSRRRRARGTRWRGASARCAWRRIACRSRCRAGMRRRRKRRAATMNPMHLGGDDDLPPERRRRGGNAIPIPIPIPTTRERRRRGGEKNEGGTRNGSRHRLVAVSLDLSLSAHANARFHHDRRKALEAKLRKTERANAHGAVDAALARRGALPRGRGAAGEGADAGPRRRGR